MEGQRPVRCRDNEEVALYLWTKREKMAMEANGISEKLDATLSNAYRNICNSQTPIMTLKDLSEIKGVGKWLLRLMQGFFSRDLDTSQTEKPVQSGKKTKGSKRYAPQKNSVAYALLIALYRGVASGSSFMRKQELIDAAEASGLSRTSILPEKKGKPGQSGSSSRDWYTGWSCMKTLIGKGLIVKSSCPAKYMLTEEGKEAARECLSRSGLAGSSEVSTSGVASLNSHNVRSASEPDFSHATTFNQEIQLPSADMKQRMKLSDTLNNFLGMKPYKDQVDTSDSDSVGVLEEVLPVASTACTSTDRGVDSGYSDGAAQRPLSLQDPHVHIPQKADGLQDKGNVLVMPPCTYGEKFEDTYVVVLILDDRENFGSLSRKAVDNIRSQFNIEVERCGIQKLIYLVEGDPNTSEAAESIKTACFTTEILEGFDVQRSSGITDTMKKYGFLTESINRYYRTHFPNDKSKNGQLCPSYDEFVKKCQDLEKMTVSDVFALQLMQVPQVTEEVALAVVELYPTLLSLARAYSLLEGDVHAQEEMLQSKNNLINRGASRNIFKLVWGC